MNEKPWSHVIAVRCPLATFLPFLFGIGQLCVLSLLHNDNGLHLHNLCYTVGMIRFLLYQSLGTGSSWLSSIASL